MTWFFFILGASMPFPEYLAKAEIAFDDSPLAQELDQADLAQRVGFRERLEQSPFVINSGGSTTWYQQVQQGVTDPQRFLAATPTVGLSYLPRLGLEASLVGSYDYATFQNFNGVNSHSHPFNLSLRVGYDVLQGGTQSTAWLAASSAAMQAKGLGLDIRQRSLDARIGFLQLMTDIFVTTCGVHLRADVRKQIDATLKSAGLQLKTGIMGQLDYFNFSTLDSGVATQEIQLQAFLDQLREQARSFGPKASQLLEALEKDIPTCSVDITATQNLATDNVLSPQELETWTQALPATLGARAFVDSAVTNLAATKKALRPSLVPFVNAQLGQPDLVIEPRGQVMVGLSFDWNPPGVRGEFATQEVKHQLGSAEARAQSAYLQSRAALRQLNSQLTYQAQVLEVLKKALADSQRLIEILEAQRLIGEIDSLNFTTAFINSVTLRQSMLDAWGAVQKGVFAHHIYERWVNTASRHTAYRHPQLRLRAN